MAGLMVVTAKFCSRLLVAAVSVVVLFIGCSTGSIPTSEQPVATVGDRTITVKDLRTYIDSISDSSEKVEPRDQLQAMIDVELLLREALSQGFDRSRAFLSRLDRMNRTKLVGALQSRVIKVSADENDLDDYVNRERLNKAIRIADIRLPSLEAAGNARSEIVAGADFADVARLRSTNQRTASRGGDLGRYAVKGQMIAPLEEKLFSLPVGSVSEPIQVPGGYSLFKILDERTFELNAQQRNRAVQGVTKEMYQAARDSLVADLKQQFQVQPISGGLTRFVETLRRGEYEEDDPFEIGLYRFEGGEITAGDVLAVAKYMKGDVIATLNDEKIVSVFAEERVLPDVLIRHEAIRRGIDSEPEVAKWLDDQADQLLIRGLRAKVIKERVSITEDAVRNYYNKNAGKFLHPEHTEVEEVLSKTESEALRIKKMVQEGASLSELAEKHSIRSVEDEHKKGHFHIHRHEAHLFGGFVEVAVEAPIGEVMGPTKVREGYSVFKVRSRDRKRETYEEARLRARSQLKRKLYREGFNDYMRELRQRYDSQVDVYDDAVEAVSLSQ